MNKKMIYSGIAAAVVAGALTYNTTFAKAEGDSSGRESLITRIAQKFNLNEADVKSVFEEDRAFREEERKAMLETKLNQAVTDGKITADQKSAILSKLSEMEDNRPNPGEMESKTPEERKAEMESRKADMEKWAGDNGLSLESLQSLMGGFGRHGVKGMGKPF